jgi:Tfp pilus assembly protein PilX
MRLIKATKILNNQKGIVLVVCVILVAVLLLLGATAIMISSTDINISSNYRSGKQVFYIAESGLEHARAVLKNSTFNSILLGNDGVSNTTDDGILSFGSSVNFGGGAYQVRVTDNNDGDSNSFSDSDNTVLVTSTGTLPNGAKRTIQTLLQKITPNPVGVRAAITSNGPIDTLGNLTVDGRDHDINGNLIGSGLWGISTRSTYSRGGNSRVGGTNLGTSPVTNIAPTISGFEPIIEANATWSPPLTPDEGLGLPEGTLKSYAQSGAGGSRYVTDPSSLTMPLSGVTYIELPSGNTWQAIDFANSSGVLVVHNSSTDAILKNTNGGTFKGIIIADDYIHIHDTVIGAVMTLSTAPSTGNCIGNGNGDVLYSSTAISNALSSLTGVRLVSWHDVY